MSEIGDGVMFVHAFPLDARMWMAQAEAVVENGWPAATPSMPGFGRTPDAGRVMSMGAAADRCLQSADAAGLERMVVCGSSMGGYVAFELWRMARQRIAGLVLANTRSGADPPEGAQSRRALADRLEAEGNGFLVADPPPLLSDGASDELRASVRRAIADQPASSIAAAARGIAERRDSTPDLVTIDVPVLIITSEHDTLIQPEVSASMADHLPDARLVTIPRAGHLSSLEAPRAFTDALVGFLAGFERL